MKKDAEKKERDRPLTLEEIKERVFLTPQEVADILGFSKSFLYEFIKGDECPFYVLQVGARYTIPTNSFLSWYESMK
jgi:excisionase family DNA binding protein